MAKKVSELTESGGPTTQAGIRYQDRVAALYLGRMVDPRERPHRQRPVEVRVESPTEVDDIVVRFDDGSRRFFQVKLALRARGPAWDALWPALSRQLKTLSSPDDRLELILGEPSALASDLKAMAERTDGEDETGWYTRLTTAQRKIVAAISKLIKSGRAEILRIFQYLDVSVWPAKELARDYAPLWMPSADVPVERLFELLAAMAWAGAETRSRFDGASLRDRLRAEQNIILADPPNWGLESYRAAIVALADIEVPGCDFRQAADADFLWPRCLRYDRDRRPDFDDDMPGWRDLSAFEEVDLRAFPGNELDAVVVIAGPGFGKSTLVNAVARKSALAGLVPAIITVTTFSDSDLTIADYLEQVINSEFDVKIDWRAASATGALVLLLDGLDEVSSDRRSLILERLKVYRAAHPGVRWMMTVRDASVLAPPDGATMVELAPLGNTHVSQYVSFYRPGETGVADALIDRIDTRPDLAQLARIPIFLALMLVLRLEREDLRRSDLLEIYIETLFRPAAFKRTETENIDTTSLRRIAERAAFEAIEIDAIGVTNQQLARCVATIVPGVSSDNIREALVRRGVLRRSGLVRLAFPFPIVQEYLSSAELLAQPSTDLAQRIGRIARRPWAQAIQFVLERHPDTSPLVAHILGMEDDAFHTGARLLGRCLANGMTATPAQRGEIGNRLAAIWGGTSWRTNRLINAIIVDAFALPLHPAVRRRLGERRLIHEGSDTIVASNRNTELSMSVLRELLAGDIEHLLHLGELQREVDRIGTAVFDLYIERCRAATNEEEENAIASLLGHMKIGRVDADAAYAVARDNSLPSQVRLAAWRLSSRSLDAEIENLLIEAMNSPDYHPQASAAQALSSPQVEMSTIVRLIESEDVPSAYREKILDYLIHDWSSTDRLDRMQELLAANELSSSLRDLLLLYLIENGDMQAFDELIDRMMELDAEMISATVILLGHTSDRRRVERITTTIAAREWSARDRVDIAVSLATGLTYRLRMHGKRTGTLTQIPLHPGLTVSHELLQGWLAYDDYEATDRLRLVLEAIRLGVVDARPGLRELLDTVLAGAADNDSNRASLAARAIEILHGDGERFSLSALEEFVRDGSYNLATSAAALIAAGGTQVEAHSLMRLYEEVPPSMLRSVILTELEPLASRLGLRITRDGERLLASEI